MQFRCSKWLLPVVVWSLSPLAFSQTTSPYTYYFAHVASGGIWRTTFTYVNPGDSFVTCETSFYSDSGGPQKLSLGGIKGSVFLYTIPAGGTVHNQSDPDASGPVQTGWARSQCSGAVKASALFRSYAGAVPQAEASVLASTNPAERFITYADQITGVAYANPQLTSSTVTFTVRNLAGQLLATRSVLLPGMNHGAFNVGPFLDVKAFQGSMEISASSPIVSLALNFEATPVFSALPPGEDDSKSDFAIPIASTDVLELRGDDNQYLGLVSFAKRMDLTSVFNPLGSYGSSFSQTSILNAFSNYGSSVSDLSAFNATATRPPTLLINGTVAAKLTTNQSILRGVDPWYLLGYIREKNY